MRDTFGRVAMALAVAALLACLCLAGDNQVPGVVLIVKKQEAGSAILQPVLPVQFAVEMVARGPDGATAAQGDAITCKAFKRTTGVFSMEDKTPALLHELALDCGGRIYVIKRVLFSK